MRDPTSAVRGEARGTAWRVIFWVSAVALGVGAENHAKAASYDYGVTRFELTGATTFLDDFADGERDLPPTSALEDSVGVTTEIVGSLRLTDADGAGPTGFPNGATGLLDIAILNPATAPGPGIATAIARLAAALASDVLRAARTSEG